MLREILVLVNAGSIAGGWDLGGKRGIGAEHFDGLKEGESENLEAAFLKLCYLGIGPSINDHVGHDIVCLEIVKRDDHPARGGSGRGCNRVERGDGRVGRVHRDVRPIGIGAGEIVILMILGRRGDVHRAGAVAVARLWRDELNLEVQWVIGLGRWGSHDDERLGAKSERGWAKGRDHGDVLHDSSSCPSS